jgi:hypothetical protein
MGPCGKAAAGHEESNHTSGCSYFAILISESGWARSAGFSWINLKITGKCRRPGDYHGQSNRSQGLTGRWPLECGSLTPLGFGPQSLVCVSHLYIVHVVMEMLIVLSSDRCHSVKPGWFTLLHRVVVLDASRSSTRLRSWLKCHLR